MEGSAGFAVMTHCFQFFVVADISRPRDEIRVKKIADLPCKCQGYTDLCIDVFPGIRVHIHVHLGWYILSNS